jgi:hypothetical protein
MKKFVIQTLAAFCVFILYARFAIIELSLHYDNYLGFIAFPILIPVCAWIYDWDL